MGSGNIGATNVHRTAGTKAGVVVLLLDILKGFLAVAFAAWISHNDAVAVAAAMFAVMVGHCYPVLLRFKGGKAVACFVGAALYVAPVALAVTTVVFVLVVAWSRYISLGSIMGALAFPAALLLLHPSRPLLAAAVLAALLVVYRHKANIHRLRSGTENVFSLKGGSTR
jgi:glycerol-3-phosphate acyltransferase PlsY